jgi:hypothetical protein
MSQQLINIGSLPADGSGDPIRVSFNKINQNFTEIYTNISDISSNIGGGANIVTSVAGKTGQVQLGVNDVLGAASKGYVDNRVSLELGLIIDSAPSTLDTIKELADAINNDPQFYLSLNEKLPIHGGVMTGPLTLASDPSVALHAATKHYVDNLVVSNSADFSTLSNTVAALSSAVSSLTAVDTTQALSTNVYTKAEIDQLLLNITNDYGFVNDTNWGLINQPVTIIEDNGSII